MPRYGRRPSAIIPDMHCRSRFALRYDAAERVIAAGIFLATAIALLSPTLPGALARLVVLAPFVWLGLIDADQALAWAGYGGLQ